MLAYDSRADFNYDYIKIGECTNICINKCPGIFSNVYE